jgi:hypothetical protein
MHSRTGTGRRATPGEALGWCRSSQLRLTSDVDGWHGNYSASNQYREPFVFTNVSHSECTLEGWPRLTALVAGVPRRTTVTRVRQNAAPAPPSSTVVVRPAGWAVFDLYGEDYDDADSRTCPDTSGFLVAPPPDSSPISVGAEVPDCGSSFYLAPVISGRIDRQAWSVVVTAGSSQASPGRVTGLVEPVCIPHSEGPSPIALTVTASKGGILATSDHVVANRSNGWHPSYVLILRAGSYVVTSSDGGSNAPMAIRSAAVGVRPGATTHRTLLSRCS